jgi:metallophosphoesterase (TIGR00282 family)
MGQPGIGVVESVLPLVISKYKVDVVIAQAENLSDGKGIRVEDFNKLRGIGVDFCTGGNWSLYKEDIIPYLDNPEEPIIRPANYPDPTPGKGYKYLKTKFGPVLVISLLGKIIGRDAEKPIDNPLHTVDMILASAKADTCAVIINFHGDYSSEKKVIGYYLDGRASAVIGDHWHIPTADAMVLPKHTAHITDVGMCGSLDSSLGVTLTSIMPRWYSGKPTKNVLETSGRMQFNAVLIDINPKNRQARSIKQIQQIIDARPA